MLVLVLSLFSEYLVKRQAKRLLYVVIVLCFWAVTAMAESVPPSAERILANLNVALKQQNYTGVFIYEFGSQFESYRIEHNIVAGREVESLYRLSGNEQEFVRTGDVGCGTLGNRLLSGQHLNMGSGQTLGLEKNYRLVLAGQDRIAGRPVWVVQIMPNDEYRYGLILSIDQQSHLLMRSVVFDAQKVVPLERLQFVSLDVGTASPSAVTEGVSERTATELSPSRCVGKHFSAEGHSPWKPTWVPAGFIHTGYAYTKEDGYMETYTDGLSAFSVFVKSVESPKHNARTRQRTQQGVSARGAGMALVNTLVQGGQTLTVVVVGEIPFPTAQKIVQSVRLVELAEDPNP